MIMGCPIYMASIPTEVKDWFDHDPLKRELAGKLGGAFATADYVHGGGELGIQSILDHMLVLGMLAYSRRRKLRKAGHPPGPCQRQRPFPRIFREL